MLAIVAIAAGCHLLGAALPCTEVEHCPRGTTCVDGACHVADSDGHDQEGEGEGEGEGEVPGAPVAGLSDWFDDGVIGAGWLVAENGGCAVDEGGSLQMTLPATGPSICSVASFTEWDLTGGAVVLRVDPITDFETDTAYTLAILRSDGGRAQLGFRGGDFSSGIQGALVDSAYPPEPYFWRIRESGGTLFFESSLDNDSWSLESSAVPPFSVQRVHVLIEARNGTSSTRSIGIGTGGVYGE